MKTVKCRQCGKAYEVGAFDGWVNDELCKECFTGAPAQPSQTSDKSQPSEPVSKPVSGGRIIGGLLFIFIFVAGGYGNLTQEQRYGSQLEATLAESSRPLGNAIVIIVMLLAVIIGLKIMGIRFFPKKKS